MITYEIEEYCRRVGIKEVELLEDELIAFDIEDLGMLFLEKNNQTEELYIYVSSEAPAYNDDIYKKVLSMSNYKNSNKYILYSGIHNNSIILLTKLKFSDVLASQIENISQFLIEKIQKLI